MDIAAELRQQGDRAIEWVMTHREEILAAFVAKYGCQPDECVMVEQTSQDGFSKTWRVVLLRDAPDLASFRGELRRDEMEKSFWARVFRF